MLLLPRSFGAAGLIAAALIALPHRAAAEERIERFEAAVSVGADGAVEVTERIEVAAEGNRIKRGIFRELPQIRSFGPLSLRLPLEVRSVSRDGSPEPFHIVNTAGGIRIYIGDADTRLRPDTYSYELVYRSRGQLGHFDEHDELYWNVTGNDWELPIERAAAEVTLPAGVSREAIRQTAYTGPRGATGSDGEIDVLMETRDPGAATFATTERLPPGHGLTIVVGWPKGVVAAPGAWERTGWLVRGWLQVTILGSLISQIIAIVTGSLLAIFFFTWLLFGREPRRGPIEPRSAPPASFTPADALILSRMRWSPRALVVAIVDLAVRGKLLLEEPSPGKWALRLPGAGLYEMQGGEKEAYNRDLTARDRRLLEALFGAKKRISLARPEANAFLRALYVIQQDTERATRSLFRAPLHLAAGGVHLAPALLLGGAALFLFVALMPSIGGGLMTLVTWGIAVAIQLTAALVWRRALRRRTAKGRAIMDELEGLRLWIENDRSPVLESTERLLPYAMALGLEAGWASSLERALQVRAPAPTGSTPPYSPDWLSSTYLDPAALALPHALCRTLENSLAPATNASATSSGSSSLGSSSGGSSGFSGGSSGGGGGGGGGGGW
jgi:uncharacterized membrane protein YgcG